MPSLTFQCGSTLALSSFCFLARSSLDSFLRVRRSMAACQLVRSLPLNRAVKPLGGVLSFGPALSSAGSALSARPVMPAPSRPASASAPSKCFIRDLLYRCSTPVQLQPQRLVVAQHLGAGLRVGVLGVHFDQRRSVVALLAQQLEQLAVGVRARGVLVER